MTDEPIKETDSEGREVLKYASGMVRDVASGKIIVSPHNTKITPANAAQMGRRRWEKTKEKFREAIIANTPADKLPPGGDASDAAAIAAGQVWKDAIYGEKSHPRDALDALESITRMADLIPPQRETINLPITETGMDFGTLGYIMHIYAAAVKVSLPENIIDGEAHDLMETLETEIDKPFSEKSPITMKALDDSVMTRIPDQYREDYKKNLTNAFLIAAEQIRKERERREELNESKLTNEPTQPINFSNPKG